MNIMVCIVSLVPRRSRGHLVQLTGAIPIDDFIIWVDDACVRARTLGPKYWGGGGGGGRGGLAAQGGGCRRPSHGKINIIVTGFGKTLRMGFFPKIEFDAWLISFTIELTRVQVLDRLRASLRSYSALFAIVPHPQ